MVRKVKLAISIQEAMDNLAAISEIDLKNPPPLGIIKKNKLVTSEEEFNLDTVQWLSSEGSEVVLEILDLTYLAIQQHLMNLMDDPEINWESEKTQKGVAALMTLVGESATKMEDFLELRLGSPLAIHIVDREEFKSLQKFYTKKFVKKFAEGIQGEQAWSKEWQNQDEESLLDLTKAGLQSFETVTRDLEYELFYIRKEDGKPYFNAELLKNIKLTCDFELGNETFEEDPLLKMRTMQDRDLHSSAAQILSECHAPISDFYKILRTELDNQLASTLNQAIIALFLASNPRNLIQNTSGKSALQYMGDFHQFLRKAIASSEYQKIIAYPPNKKEKVPYLLLYLTHQLTRSFFERIGGVKQEAIGLIHRTMRKGEEIKQKEKKHLLKGDTIWNQFLIDDEKFRTLLSQFPNGPLFKILDLVREEQDEGINIPFDPIGQQNLPSKIYEIHQKGRKIDVLRIPSPTTQGVINKVEIIGEFRSFLRALASENSPKKHLMINLQDRTSWKEFARCNALEKLQKNAEFSQQLIVLTLPKHTDFYYQNNEYMNLNKADEFIKALQEQFASAEECGFFFPSEIKQIEMTRFMDLTLPVIHEYFFENKNTLTRKNREDFIEILYQFLILKCIDLLEPTSISFTCKDAIDTGPVAQATFYAFIQLLTSDFSKKEEQDFYRWQLYAPALFIRERATDPERVNRSLSILERIDAEMAEQGKKIFKVFGNFYQEQFFKTLGVKHL